MTSDNAKSCDCTSTPPLTCTHLVREGWPHEGGDLSMPLDATRHGMGGLQENQGPENAKDK